MKVVSKKGQEKKAGLQEQINAKAKELGFKGKPLIVTKYVNKLRQETGNREHDLEAGNIAFKVGDELHISPAIGKIYFECNFVAVKQ